MRTWITKQKNIAWLDDNESGYFYDAFWNPPPLYNKDEEVDYGWMVLK